MNIFGKDVFSPNSSLNIFRIFRQLKPHFSNLTYLMAQIKWEQKQVEKSDSWTYIFEKRWWKELLDTRHNSIQPHWKLNKRIYLVSDWPFCVFPPSEETKYKPNVFRTEVYEFKEYLPTNLVFSGNEDQSKNPISSSRNTYFQGGSACQYAINVKKCSRFLL